MAKKVLPAYQNNPFLIGLDGVKLLFNNAPNVGIYTLVMTSVLFVLSLLWAIAQMIVDATHPEGRSVETVDGPLLTTGAAVAFLVVFIVGLILYVLVTLLLFGVTEYTAAQLAKGKRVGLQEAFKAVLRRYPGYVFMYLVVVAKVMLWSLLFIVPGIIMANRYILSGTVFFAEGKKGNAAIKRSAELTKNAWLTTYAGTWLWNMISQGLVTMVFWPGQMAVLYRQLAAVTDGGHEKPPAHILSWLTLLLPLVFLTLILALFAFIVVLLATSSTAP